MCKIGPYKAVIAQNYMNVSVSAEREVYSPAEMWWHMVTLERGSEGETGEWSG
jgi:hypothetical protein